jgi:hypothetical protein
MKFALIMAFACAAALAGPPRITYIKEFPGSTPPYVSVTVSRDGAAAYKESPNDEDPLEFRLTDDETAQVFDLAGKLDHFKRPLEAKVKVANMGAKTFRYEDDAGTHEVKFNYSTDPDAQALTNFFERVTESEQNFIRLERAVKYDRLGVNDAILQLAISYDKKRLVAPQQFLPLLDRVAKNESFMHMARERAAALADSIRGKAPKAE